MFVVNINAELADSTYTGTKDAISISTTNIKGDLPQPMTAIVRSVDPVEP